MSEEVEKVEIDDGKIHCTRCKRRMLRKEFYLDKNTKPMEKCKKCMTSMIDVESPSTFIIVLEEIDIPYAPLEWEKLKERYLYIEQNGVKRRNPNANQSILGRYIGKMKLAQYKDLTYADTKRFVEEEGESRANQNAELLDRFKNFLDNGLNEEDALAAMGMPINTLDKDEVLSIPKSFYSKEELTELQIKWGSTYIEKEIVQLENLYNDMNESFEITTASHEDYLRQICKTSFRMHQAIDTGDFDTYHKLSQTYDKMMKSAKFTASQEKEEERFVDSISEMVKLCEEQGFIPLYHTFEEKDVVDVTERDLKNYTSNLIRGELGLGDLIEQAVESIKLEEAKDNLDENGEEDLFDVEIAGPTEEDYLDDLEKEMAELGPVKEFEKADIAIEGEINE